LSSWTQHEPNMNPSIHIPKCFPSVFKHSQTNIQVPSSPATWQFFGDMEKPSEKIYEKLVEWEKDSHFQKWKVPRQLQGISYVSLHCIDVIHERNCFKSWIFKSLLISLSGLNFTRNSTFVPINWPIESVGFFKIFAIYEVALTYYCLFKLSNTTYKVHF